MCVCGGGGGGINEGGPTVLRGEQLRSSPTFPEIQSFENIVAETLRTFREESPAATMASQHNALIFFPVDFPRQKVS